MKKPDFSKLKLPTPNFAAIPGWIKSHKIPAALIALGIVAVSVGGWKYSEYKNEQARLAAEAAQDFSLKALTIDQLVGGNYYIKDGDNYYLVAKGIMYSTGAAVTIPEEASPNERIVMFGRDDEQIPTLYKDTQLIYKSADFDNPSSDGTVPLTPSDFYLERFSDQGYSIGIRGLINPDGTKYQVPITTVSFYPGSSVTNLKLKKDEILTLDKINGVPINESNVSSVGTVTGLTQNKPYTVDAYIGTTPVGGEVIADTHMFASFELYDLKDYELDAAGYGIITIPDYMWSGYYYINGMGMFRYVNDYKTYGISADIDYNIPYFMGKDKAGNIIKNPAPANSHESTVITDTDESVAATTDGSDTITTTDEDPFTYHYKVTIDNQQKSMNISIEYSEAMTYTDSGSGDTYSILKASDGVLIPGASTPTAILTSPSGQRYTMTNLGAIMEGSATSLSEMAENTQSDAEMLAPNSLVATIDNPEVGTWNVDIMGMYARAFTVSTSYAGSSTNMVVKDSSNATNMVVYVPENLTDAVFKFTWDELGHTGTFSVVGPDKKEVATNARDNDNNYKEPDQVLAEQYGEVDLHIGEAVAGEYKVKITGESLGHVYWNYIDRANGDSTIGESENTDDAASEASSTDSETSGTLEP